MMNNFLRARINLLEEHRAAEDLRERQRWQVRRENQGTFQGGDVTSKRIGSWKILKKGARIERLQKYNPTAAYHESDGHSVIRYNAEG